MSSPVSGGIQVELEHGWKALVAALALRRGVDEHAGRGLSGRANSSTPMALGGQEES